MPLQDGTEGPPGLHRCLELTQRVVWQQRHRYVIKQPLAECLERDKEAKASTKNNYQNWLKLVIGFPFWEHQFAGRNITGSSQVVFRLHYTNIGYEQSNSDQKRKGKKKELFM